MIPLSRVAIEIPQTDNVVCGILTYSYSSRAGGKLGKTKVMLRESAKMIANIVLAADIFSLCSVSCFELAWRDNSAELLAREVFSLTFSLYLQYYVLINKTVCLFDMNTENCSSPLLLLAFASSNQAHALQILRFLTFLIPNFTEGVPTDIPLVNNTIFKIPR